MLVYKTIETKEKSFFELQQTWRLWRHRKVQIIIQNTRPIIACTVQKMLQDQIQTQEKFVKFLAKT